MRGFGRCECRAVLVAAVVLLGGCGRAGLESDAPTATEGNAGSHGPLPARTPAAGVATAVPDDARTGGGPSADGTSGGGKLPIGDASADASAEAGDADARADGAGDGSHGSCGPCLSCAWTIEQPPQSGRMTRLALGPDSRPHVVAQSYPDSSTLSYSVRRLDGTWSEPESVGTSSGLTAIVVDRQGHPHVAYRSPAWQSLVHATRSDAGAWVSDNVQSGGDFRWGGSLALDAAGTLHAVYAEMTSRKLRHATRDASGPWSISDVADSAFYTAAGIDALGQIHVAFFTPASVYGAPSYGLRDVAGVWTTRALEPGLSQNAGWQDLSVGSDGWVHAVFPRMTATGADLVEHLSRSPSGEIYYDALDDAHTPEVQIAAGSGGAFHLAYTPGCCVDPDAGTVQYAYHDGPSRTGSRIDDGISVLGDIQADPNGGVHIVYFNATARVVRYAYRPGTCR